MAKAEPEQGKCDGEYKQAKHDCKAKGAIAASALEGGAEPTAWCEDKQSEARSKADEQSNQKCCTKAKDGIYGRLLGGLLVSNGLGKPPALCGSA